MQRALEDYAFCVASDISLDYRDISLDSVNNLQRNKQGWEGTF
jgi:hypothetical protein